MLQILAADGTITAGSQVPALSSDQLLELYGRMVGLRVIDEKMITMQRQGRVGFYGACTGQEAATLGSGLALQPQDWVFPALREGGVALMRGFPLRRYVAQILGNSADILKGRQMPSHYSDRSVNQVSWSSCIATQLPHAVGAAMAMKMTRSPSACIAYLGDGATSEGDFHVSMNFAGVFAAPVVFFCQNNQWSISVPVQSQTAAETIAAKAQAYGFEGLRVDGNDVLAVYEATRLALQKARSGNGPTLIEALTYRVGAHSTSDDPSRYRDESITEEWKTKKDPLDRFEKFLLGRKVLSPKVRKEIRKEASRRIEAAIKEVEPLPPPPIESLFEDVFSEPPWHLQEQARSFLQER